MLTLCSEKIFFLTKVTNFSSGDKKSCLQNNLHQWKLGSTKFCILKYLEYQMHYILVICLLFFPFFISLDLFRSKKQATKYYTHSNQKGHLCAKKVFFYNPSPLQLWVYLDFWKKNSELTRNYFIAKLKHNL